MWILPWLATCGFAFSAAVFFLLFGLTRKWDRLVWALFCVAGLIVAGYFAAKTIEGQRPVPPGVEALPYS
jgi:hypothetical protein